MPEGIRLEALRADHAAAVLRFEQENRAYFRKSIPDRGDSYFAEFPERLQALLAEQDAGTCRFHVLIDTAGDVVGRVNLVDIADGSAELGYRFAESATGRGLATAAVRRICAMAVAEYGLRALRATTTWDNPASQTVLQRAGFVATATIGLNARPGTRYDLSFTDEIKDDPHTGAGR